MYSTTCFRSVLMQTCGYKIGSAVREERIALARPPGPATYWLTE